jgi:hypothetical protein
MKIMDIIPSKYTKHDTWEKDGVLMCSKECCGAPVSECTCGPECKHCNCFELKKTNESPAGYGMQKGVAMNRKVNATNINQTKRANNKNADANRELNIANKALTRRASRLSKKMATGMPQRILNPQPAQDTQQ